MSQLLSNLSDFLPELSWLEVFIAGLSTLAIYSFLYKENSFYRFFEHFYIGIAAGIALMVTVRIFLWNQIFKPIVGADLPQYPDPSYAETYDSSLLFFLVPAAFGLLYYCILSRRWAWLAQLPIGFSLGVSGGMAFKGTFNELMPQLYDSIRPLWIVGDLRGSVENIIFTFTLLTAFSYFFFTLRGKKTNKAEAREVGLVENLQQAAASREFHLFFSLPIKSLLMLVLFHPEKVGRWMMMACFGAFFGATIMARMSLLVERLQFLIDKWVPGILSVF